MASRLALLNGRVYTQDDSCPRAEAIGIVGNRIAVVGSPDDVIGVVGQGAEQIDLGRRAVVPGLMDAHFHLLGYCASRREIDLASVSSLHAALERIASTAEKLPSAVWLVGRGWNRHDWPGKPWPTRHDLDRVIGDRPAFLLSRDHHAAWVSSAALKLAGIGPGTPDPPGGRIMREQDGSPNGVLFESAVQPLRAILDQPTTNDGVVGAIRLAQSELLSLGITGLHNFEGSAALRALEILDAAGELRLRVSAGLSREMLDSAATLGLHTGVGSDRLRVGLLKLFADGALGSGTAAMLDPYEGSADDRGIVTIDRAELVDLMRRAAAIGIGVATHAIGDAAVRMVLDAAEVVRAADPSSPQILRIEHAQLVDDADLPRFSRLRIVASMQPIHATSDMHMADERWGARCRSAYPWRGLLDAGAVLALGTDCPVEPPDPFLSIHAAVTRQRAGRPAGGWYPEHRLTIAEAMFGYTVGSARAAGLSAELGSISPGKLADVIVLNQDPYTIAPEDLDGVGVVMTIFDGQVVYSQGI